MPQPLAPPFAVGSTTIPRQLQRWLDINPQGGQLTRTRFYISLPAFSVSVNWIGVSDIVASFNFEASKPFSFVGTNTLPASANYLLAVMWKDGSGNTHRYALWNNVGEVIKFNLPLYSGQLIKQNFRLEVWSTNVATCTNSSAIILYTSALTGLDYRYGSDTNLQMTDGLVTQFGNMNSTAVLPNNGLDYHFISTSGLTTSSGGTVFVSWTDSVQGLVLGHTNTVAVVTDAQINKPAVSITTSTANITGVLDGQTNLSIVFAFLLQDASTSGTLFNDGGGNVINFDHVSSTLRAYEGSPPGIPIVIDTWYIIVLDANEGTISIYNQKTGLLVGAQTNSASVGGSNTLIVGNLNCLISEIAIYINELSSSDLNLALGYFTQSYFNTNYSLPLTFPVNSTPQPNI